MPLLIIGLISIITFISCKKRVEYISYFDYKYMNTSSDTIYIQAFKIRYPHSIYKYIAGGKTLVVTASTDTGIPKNEVILSRCDSAFISYKDTTIRWTREMDSDRNPLLIKNYETYHTGTRRTEHVFTFKDEDFR